MQEVTETVSFVWNGACLRKPCSHPQTKAVLRGSKQAMVSSRPLAAAVLAAALALPLLAAPSHALIMRGPTMIDPPTELGKDPIGDDHFFAFYEKQNVVLDRDVKFGKKTWLDEGTLVSSHYVLYDPAELVRHSVTIEFDSEILGVYSTNKKLKKTDFLGADGDEYKRFRHRGHEWRDHYEISADGKSITFHYRAGSPGDYIRIVTRGETPPPPPPNNPVPEPGAALLFGIGAACTLRFTGRKKLPSR